MKSDIAPATHNRKTAKLASGLFDREIIVDNFAGGGGASMGIEEAMGRAVDIAINHDRASIEMHSINHPHTTHLCEDVWDIDPLTATGGRPVGLAWYSPDCRHHSRAKGGKPVNKRIRGLAWVVVKWAKIARPRVIMLENVMEFEGWGPLLHASGVNGVPLYTATGEPVMLPDKTRKGQTFKRWISNIRNLGYQLEWRPLNAAAYGARTHRRRLFIIARCDGLPIIWPEPSHGPGLKNYLTFRKCINWAIPMSGRVRSDVQRQRIAIGCKDRPGEWWILKYYGHGGEQTIDEPLHTITSKDRFALISPTGQMRMLRPRELARAQGFPDRYVLTGTQKSQVARIGNSVSPVMGKALVKANFSPVDAERLKS